MDIAVLTAFLSPFLPFLLKFGGKATEKAGEKFGEDAWNKAKAIWAKLHPQVDAKAAAQEAAVDVATDPDDADSQAALRKQLMKILDNDAELAAAIAQILQEPTPDGTPGMQIVQTVTGDRNQSISQMTGGTAVGNVERNAFMISGGTITNFTGEGTINYQESPHQSRNLTNPKTDESIDKSDV